MKVLVAGGAGFIGTNLCAALLARGDEVICADNLVTGRLANLTELSAHPGFSFVEQDVTKELPHWTGIDRVFHLASPASPPGYVQHQVETLWASSTGTGRLLDLAEHNGARFIFASTSEVYGDPLEHPQREDYRGNVSSIGPRSMYDEAKRFGEALIMAYLRTRDVDARIVRIFNTYGPFSDPEDGRMVPNFITQALKGEPLTVYSDGAQTRSLCYVSDLVEGLLRAIETDGTRGEVINLGNPEEHTVLEFARLIAELAGSGSQVRYMAVAVGDDPQRRSPDIAKAKRLLGWEPVVSLKDGIRRTIDYFRGQIAAGVS